MKNILTSLACIAISFCITSFALDASAKSSDEHGHEHGEDCSIDHSSEEKRSANFVGGNSSDLDFSEMTSSYEAWNSYQKENIELTTDFIPVDTNGEEISKKTFLEKLLTGKYIPVKLFDAEYMYQLYTLDGDADEKITKAIKTSSNIVYSYFLKEDGAFPEFNFTDLNGNNYTSNNTKGQIIVIECWFIQCTSCIQEFPKLNDLYDKYEEYEDLQFLSLAFDSADRLKKFLIKKEFRYPVIPDQKDFIKNQIQVKHYPTHIILDEYGNVKKMVNNADALSLALSNIMNTGLLEDEL